MWGDLTITTTNQAKFEALCRRLTQHGTQRIFSCGHRKSCRRKGDKFITETANTTTHARKRQPTAPPQPTDISGLQREVLRVVMTSGVVEERVGAVGYAEVCQAKGEVVEDDVLVKVCKNAEEREETVVALVGKLLLLPKLYHMTAKLSTPVMDSLTQLMETHAAVLVKSTLLPLLHHLPALQDPHRDVLAHLIPLCSPAMATSLLRVYAKRRHHSETDLPTFHLLCDTAEVNNPDTHTAVLAVAGKIAAPNRTSVKFGQCLLAVVRRFGPHLDDLEPLRGVVMEHESSLRKVVDLQMRKLERSRQ